MLRSLAFSFLLLPLGLTDLAAQDAPGSAEKDRDAMLRQLGRRLSQQAEATLARRDAQGNRS